MAVLKYKDSNNLWLPLVNYNVTTPDVVQVTGTSTSDVMSQKAVTDLLATKANSSSLATVATSGSYNDLSNKPSLATVATSGSYADLSNKPTIPAAQVNSDWNSNSGVSLILNKPDLSDYIQKSLTSGLVKNDGTIDTNTYLTKPTYTAPTAINNLIYTGTALTLLNAGTTSHGTILYSYDSITWSTTLPSKTNAGTYTVYWRLIGDSTHVDVLPLSIDVTINLYVDLGLPSGTKWAIMNVGASSETDYGNYYMYGKGATQYNSGDTPYAGTEDPLAASADTATQVLGSPWHMPTKAQFEELTANTTYQWTTIDGVNGGKFTAQNGNYVFFPAAGIYNDGSLYGVGSSGYYWSSTPNNSNRAWLLDFYDGDDRVYNGSRDFGYSVRPVKDA